MKTKVGMYLSADQVAKLDALVLTRQREQLAAGKPATATRAGVAAELVAEGLRVAAPEPPEDTAKIEKEWTVGPSPVLSAINAMRAAGLCPRGGEIVDFTTGMCSCGECPTPRPGWVRR